MTAKDKVWKPLMQENSNYLLHGMNSYPQDKAKSIKWSIFIPSIQISCLHSEPSLQRCRIAVSRSMWHSNPSEYNRRSSCSSFSLHAYQSELAFVMTFSIKCDCVSCPGKFSGFLPAEGGCLQENQTEPSELWVDWSSQVSNPIKVSVSDSAVLL